MFDLNPCKIVSPIFLAGCCDRWTDVALERGLDLERQKLLGVAAPVTTFEISGSDPDSDSDSMGTTKSVVGHASCNSDGTGSHSPERERFGGSAEGGGGGSQKVESQPNNMQPRTPRERKQLQKPGATWGRASLKHQNAAGGDNNDDQTPPMTPTQRLLGRTFLTPLVPAMPMLGLSCTMHMLLGLSMFAYIVYAIWATLGVVIYLAYGVESSRPSNHDI